MIDELHVINLVVDQAERRKGIASRMIAEMVRRGKGATSIFLEVRESSAGARAFYEKSGFVACGTRKGYYAGRETAIVMEKKI